MPQFRRTSLARFLEKRKERYLVEEAVKSEKITKIEYSEESKKMKRLSLINTLEALKKAAMRVASNGGEKVKNRAAISAKKKAVGKLAAKKVKWRRRCKSPRK